VNDFDVLQAVRPAHERFHQRFRLRATLVQINPVAGLDDFDGSLWTDGQALLF
jgi:hypothetical protein